MITLKEYKEAYLTIFITLYLVFEHFLACVYFPLDENKKYLTLKFHSFYKFYIKKKLKRFLLLEQKFTKI